MSVEKAQTVFREVFNDSDLIISRGMTAKDIGNWDSFNHIKLIVALEAAFGVSFSAMEIVEMTGVGDLIDMLKNKGADVSW
jgi:acyl carrier protein